MAPLPVTRTREPIMAYIASAVANLIQLKDVNVDTAKTVRAIWKAESHSALSQAYVDLYEVEKAFHTTLKLRALKRYCINQLLGYHGVEYLGIMKRTSEHVHYCNAGDAYTDTIVFVGDRLVVGNWGGYIEARLVNEPASL